jgi:hypothetical protein
MIIVRRKADRELFTGKWLILVVEIIQDYKEIIVRRKADRELITGKELIKYCAR